jgi:hypothetical protein
MIGSGAGNVSDEYDNSDNWAWAYYPEEYGLEET